MRQVRFTASLTDNERQTIGWEPEESGEDRVGCIEIGDRGPVDILGVYPPVANVKIFGTVAQLRKLSETIVKGLEEGEAEEDEDESA